MSLPPDHADSTKRPLEGNIEYYAERRCASGVSPVFNWVRCLDIANMTTGTYCGFTSEGGKTAAVVVN